MRHRSTLAYLWVAPVTLLGLLLALIAYWLGAFIKRRFGVLEVAGNTRTPILRSISSRFEAITLGHVILGRNHGTSPATAATSMCMCVSTSAGGCCFLFSTS